MLKAEIQTLIQGCQLPQPINNYQEVFANWDIVWSPVACKGLAILIHGLCSIFVHKQARDSVQRQ